MEKLNDRHLRIWGLPLLVALTVTAQMPIFFPGRWDLWWKFCIMAAILSSLTWEVARLILLGVRKRFQGVDQTPKRVLATLSLYIILLAVLHAGILWATDLLHLMKGPVLTLKAFLINFGIGLFFISMIGGYFEATYFFRNYREALMRTEHIKKERAQHRLAALKSKVNPHFLFNSLTTLSALIPEDAGTAERFVDELSKVYRYLLRANWQVLVPLEDELHFLRSYVFLLNIRYDGAFQIRESGLDAVLKKGLPVLSLQAVADRVTRTQVIAADRPLILDIRSEGEDLALSCMHQPRSVLVSRRDPNPGTAQDGEWAAVQPEIAEGRLCFRIQLHEKIQAT